MRSLASAISLIVAGCALAACGGRTMAFSSPDDGASDAGGDPATCTAPDYPVECDGVFLYCCLDGEHCATPSCHSVPAPEDAGAPTADDASVPVDASACPAGEFLLVPCCGGANDTSCSNGAGPPPAFCTPLPSSCDDQSTCISGGCEGVLDETTRTLSCQCI